MGAFDFLSMAGNYDQRKVARFGTEGDAVIVDTCAANDTPRPYETGISGTKYDPSGEWCVVEYYDTKADAQVGHDRWVRLLTSPGAPAEIHDVSEDEANQLCGKSGRTFKAGA